MKFKLSILFAFIVPVLVYWKMVKGFFQQDEWFGFGWSVLHRNLGFLKTLEFFFAPTGGHYNPFTIAVTQYLYTAWGMNYLPFAYLGLVLHIMVLISVYFLTKKIFRDDKWLPVFSTFLFGIFASTFQGVSWVAADISTLSATLIGVISSIFFLKFLETGKTKHLWLSLVSLLISLFFKEVTIGLFPLFLITYIIYGRKKKIKKEELLKLIIVPIAYVALRVVLFLLPHAAGMGDNVGVRSGGIDKAIYNFVSIPIKSVTQIIFPLTFLEALSRSISGLFPTKISGGIGTTSFDVFAFKRVMEFISVFVGIIISVGAFVFSLMRKNVEQRFLIIFSLGWTILGSFIFAISPGTNGIVFTIDSRNLYFTSVGISILVVYFCSLIAKKNIVFTFLILFPIFVFNVYYLNLNLNSFVQTSIVRQNVLSQIKSQHKRLSDNTVFYTESDTSFYGLPESERIMPFQSGFGQTLLASYENTNNFPKDFFSNNFLWPIDSQGYKQVNGVGFGYFRNFNELAKFYSTSDGNKPTLIAYSFNSSSNALKDITDQIRGRIDGYEAKKKMIPSKDFVISSSVNTISVKNTIDGNVKTFWNSGLPYANYQYLTIDMIRNIDIAEITINSYNDHNQNGVGYRVSVSIDGKVWNTVFESKNYPPDSSGLDNLYFEPSNARFVEIEQIGFHKYADWVISELSIYAKI